MISLRWAKSLSGIAAFAVLALGLVLSSAHAQPLSFAGHWQGTYQGVAIDLVIQPNGRYSQTTALNGNMLHQAGRYEAAPGGNVRFTVDEWQPQTMCRYHATGTVGGYCEQVPLTRPQDALDRLTMNGPNILVITDVPTGVPITLHRVP